jgi:hypothetical protein
MPEVATFRCINCRRDRPAEDAVSLSWPVHVGWLFIRGGLVGGVCRDCKQSVTLIGIAVTIFFAVAGISYLIYVAT